MESVPSLRQERSAFVTSPSVRHLGVRWFHSPKDKLLEKFAGLSHYQWHLHQLVDGQMASKLQKESQEIWTTVSAIPKGASALADSESVYFVSAS